MEYISSKLILSEENSYFLFVELFGRPHNVQPNWLTLGNQLDGVRLLEPDVVERFKVKYPNGIQQLTPSK